MKALIDGDIIVYRSAFAAEKTVYHMYINDIHTVDLATKTEVNDYIKGIAELDPNSEVSFVKHTTIEPVENVLHSMKMTLQSIIEAAGADDYQVYLTATEGNFRDSLATILPYKGNRTSRKPIHYSSARDYLVSYWGAIVVDGQEADDAMGIEQYNNLEWSRDSEPRYGGGTYLIDGHTIICTIDKDLNMIPGWHYNWVKDEKYFVDETDAMGFFYKQLLTGDSTDNILGIRGLGQKTAEALLKESDNPLCTIGLQYAIAYDDPEAAMIETANLLWIRRYENESVDFGWSQVPDDTISVCDFSSSSVCG